MTIKATYRYNKWTQVWNIECPTHGVDRLGARDPSVLQENKNWHFDREHPGEEVEWEPTPAQIPLRPRLWSVTLPGGSDASAILAAVGAASGRP